ncbi:MAG: putative short chain dehydrogenase/reductase [Rhodothermaceae bacterium]|nr:MAG: SDR family NAD(P)-dependent oxidoreductase [Bacteroidota bacterium]GIV61686.1 MAG: putative short chain dehydrogenase/reductase [Rhodothermaceae bacterium]
MPDFDNQHILITGAASGIGRLMALLFAREGATILAWDVDAVGLAALQEALAEYPGRHATYGVDLTDREAVYATARQVLDAYGRVDVLVNNAGIVSGKPLLDTPDEAIERTFAVNTLALYWTTKAFLPAMIAHGRGHVVTIASAGGLVGTARMTDYCASKFAAVGFDESLRLECRRLGYPVTTTVVCPFYIDTGMFAGVKTRFPWLLPILKPEYVARKVVQAVRKGRRRVILPRFVYTVFPLRLLPPTLFDAMLDFFGVNRTMDTFRGRSAVR